MSRMIVLALLIVFGFGTSVASAQSLYWRGATLQTITKERAASDRLPVAYGAYVTAVELDSSAELSGLTVGDIIIAVDGSPVATAEQFLTLVKTYDSLNAVSLTRLRGKTDEAEIAVSWGSSGSRGESGTKDGATSRGELSVKVYFATDRKKTGAENPNVFFGGERGTLTYGHCRVVIPENHIVGELEAPSIWRFELREDPAKHVVLAAITEQTGANFYKDIREAVATDKGKSAFIFVHGYNVSFKDAARRTAQMAYDLKFAGAPVFFSWPSRGRYLDYPVDEANNEWASADLKQFLSEFSETSSAERIHIIAHSMGSRVLASALKDVLRDNPSARSKIKEIILAAPDIDADVFRRDIAPAITGHDHSVSLYASDSDLALVASKSFHGYRRAGDIGTMPLSVAGVTTIDSSAVEGDVIGHSYFADSRTVLRDMFNVFTSGGQPQSRQYLIPSGPPENRYWKLPKSLP